MPILMITPDMMADTWLGAIARATGQPDVQRHDAGLDAEADQREHENRGGHARRQRFPGQRRQCERAAGGTQQGEQREQHSVATWVATR